MAGETNPDERVLAYETTGVGGTVQGETGVGAGAGDVDETLAAINAALAAEGVDTTGLDRQPAAEADQSAPPDNRIVLGLGSRTVRPKVGP